MFFCYRLFLAIAFYCTFVLVYMYDLSSMACAQFPSKPSTAINEFLRKAKEQRFIQVKHLLLYLILSNVPF